MITTLCAWTAMLGAPALAATPVGDPTAECGFQEGVVPDFTLDDVNPNSPTYGQERSRSDSLGRVLVVYFATAT